MRSSGFLDLLPIGYTSSHAGHTQHVRTILLGLPASGTCKRRAMQVAKRDVIGDVMVGRDDKNEKVSAAGDAQRAQVRFTREETTTKILDAAEDLFSRRDPAKVTMREIAEAAGVTHPLVHQYIGTKADVLKAVVQRGAPARQEMIATFTDLRAALPPLVEDVLSRRVHSRSIVR